MANELYFRHVIDFGGTVISGVTSQPVQQNVQVSRPLTDGMIQASSASIVRDDATIRATCLDLETVLENCDLFGAEVEDVIVFSVPMTVGGAKTASGAAVKRTFHKAFCYVESVSWSQGGDASVNFVMMALDDGETEIELIEASEDLTNATAGGSTARWAHKSLSINGSPVADVTQWNLDTGNQVAETFADGKLTPNRMTNSGHLPVFTFQTFNETFAATAGHNLALSSTGCVVTCQKRAADGRYAASNDVVFAMANGVLVPAGQSGDRPIQGGYRVDVRKPSAANSIVVTTPS